MCDTCKPKSEQVWSFSSRATKRTAGVWRRKTTTREYFHLQTQGEVTWVTEPESPGLEASESAQGSGSVETVQTDRTFQLKKNKRHSSNQVQPGDWSIIQLILGGRQQLLSTRRTGRRSYCRSVPCENKMYFYHKNKLHPFFVLPLNAILCCIWLTNIPSVLSLNLIPTDFVLCKLKPKCPFLIIL